MKSSVTYLILLLCLCNVCFGQSKYNDSIMVLRKTDSVEGFVKVIYTPGYKERTVQFQNLFEEATRFYEQRFNTKLNYKIAVLDSSQWITEKYPFGFLAYDSGWVFLPSNVDSSFFVNIYGLKNQTSFFNTF